MGERAICEMILVYSFDDKNNFELGLARDTAEQTTTVRYAHRDSYKVKNSIDITVRAASLKYLLPLLQFIPLRRCRQLARVHGVHGVGAAVRVLG